MRKPEIRNCIAFTAIIILFTFLAGCDGSPSIPELNPTSASTPTPTTTPEPTATTTPTSTPRPPVMVLLAPPEADPGLVEGVEAVLEEEIPAAGVRFQIRPSLSLDELNRDRFQWVVALPETQNLSALVEAAPETHFLSVGMQGLEAAPNLTVIGGEGVRYDQQGFMAGYIAALITPDWRVGMIGLQGTPEGEMARQGFQTGVLFLCGLCRPSYPPFIQYPLSVELQPGSSSPEWETAADFLINQAVETVYVMPGAGDGALLERLAQSEVRIIAGRTPPNVELVSDYWVASLRVDPFEAFLDVWPDFMAGDVGDSLSVPLSISNVNSRWLSPGREHMAEVVLADLLAGYIDPNRELSGGENP